MASTPAPKPARRHTAKRTTAQIASHAASLAHAQRLRDAFAATVEHLRQRRADLIDASLIEDYVALQWLEWYGGTLRLTVTGRNVCAQMAPPSIETP
ncbi:MAG: hypothetical protein ABI574_08415 [Burkholderiales bacterium]